MDARATVARKFWLGNALPIVLPFVVAAGLIAYLHGKGDARHAGELFLLPFLMSLVAVGNHPLAAFTIWVLAMTLALLAARAVHARRTAGV